jgi:hypothetical protein
MKSNKLLIALALCAAMQPNISFGAQTPQTEEPAPQSQSYWQQYAPQFMQRGTRYVSETATNFYNTVNSWSTQKKIAVASAIVASLALIYNRDTIMQMISGGIPAGKVKSMGNDSVQEEQIKRAALEAKANDIGPASPTPKDIGRLVRILEHNDKLYLDDYLKTEAEYNKRVTEYKGTFSPKQDKELSDLITTSNQLLRHLQHQKEEMMELGVPGDVIEQMRKKVRAELKRK